MFISEKNISICNLNYNSASWLFGTKSTLSFDKCIDLNLKVDHHFILFHTWHSTDNNRLLSSLFEHQCVTIRVFFLNSRLI